MNTVQILVVDDNPANLRLTTAVLTQEGYRVLQAHDAEEALRMIQQTPPDLIITDIVLPGMDGLVLTRQLKADIQFSHIPIIALTACAMEGDDRKAFAAGCNRYITKPFDIHTLVRQVASYLPTLTP